MVPFSVLDLAPIVQGGSVADALHRSRDLARHAEGCGYRRFWLAEHHNMPGIASAATAVAVAHVAAGTSTIRVGSGGIMLPNHSPLVIAEQFGTLEALFPGRIDLGLGRAPGTDPLTAHALRRGSADTADTFPQDVIELQAYFRQPAPTQRRGTPGPLPPPVESMAGRWSRSEEATVEHAFREAVVGSPATVRRGIEAFLNRTSVDELMITAAIFDDVARHQSFELVAWVRNVLASDAGGGGESA